MKKTIVNEKTQEIKNEMQKFAFDINNIPLLQAINYSETMADLRSCVKQAYGVGSERFKNVFEHVLGE